MKKTIRKFVPEWVISSYHWLWAALSAFFYGFPSEKLTVIGVTGTDGKTTTCNLLADLFQESGYKIGMATTINFRIGNKTWDNLTKQGMQGRWRTQQLLSKMVKAGCEYAIIETTSEGIKQSRHVGINYDIAVFTNLTPEHIESHGSFDNYKKAKGELFKKTAKSCKVDTEKFSIINLDDKNAQYFLQFDCEKNILYGIDAPANTKLPYLQASGINLTAEGTSFEVSYSADSHTPSQSATIQTSLVGKFNVYNTLAAMSVALSQGLALEKIAKVFASIKPVPGRMEIVEAGQPFTVIVDYAHAPNALENVYQTVKPFLQGKLWSLLGSQGGGRDKQKRPVLGELAGKYADYVVVTNEDPYDEDPKQIIDDVFAGVVKSGKIENENAWRFADRREAIKFILQKAAPEDIVLLTGKGAEQVMVVADGKKVRWDDRVEVKNILAQK